MVLRFPGPRRRRADVCDRHRSGVRSSARRSLQPRQLGARARAASDARPPSRWRLRRRSLQPAADAGQGYFRHVPISQAKNIVVTPTHLTGGSQLVSRCRLGRPRRREDLGFLQPERRRRSTVKWAAATARGAVLDSTGSWRMPARSMRSRRDRRLAHAARGGADVYVSIVSSREGRERRLHNYSEAGRLERLGQQQRKLQQRLGVSAPTIACNERQTNGHPPITILERLCDGSRQLEYADRAGLRHNANPPTSSQSSVRGRAMTLPAAVLPHQLMR